MRYGILVVWALAVMACAGGFGSTSTIGPTASTISSNQPESAALAEARDRWASEARPWYRYAYRRSCECDFDTAGPNEVLVHEDRVAEVWYEGTVDVERPVLLDPGFGWTVPQLFDAIEAAIEAGHQIDVEYAAEGYPTRMLLDLEAMAVDGGFGLDLLSFEDPTTDLADLADARSLWADAGITDYSFHFFSGSMAVSEYDVVVNGTEVFVDGDYVWGPASIDDAFDFIEEAILAAPDAFSADYDEVTGIPLGYDVDYEQYATGDESGFALSEFTVITYSG